MTGERQIKDLRGSLQDRIMTYVTKHPGVKLSAIEGEVGTSRTKAAEAIHDLIRQGKLRKDEDSREYYPFL